MTRQTSSLSSGNARMLPAIIAVVVFLSGLFFYLNSELYGKSKPKRKINIFGEYSLWVEDSGDELTIKWLTVGKDPGYLKAYREGEMIHDVSTPDSQSHTTTIAYDSDYDGEIMLEYGGKRFEDDHHQTTLYLERDWPDRKYVYKDIDSIYVFGDIHGQYVRVITLLENAGLVDSTLSWTGGGSHVVFLGDLFDRGNDVIQLLWYIYQLEQQAAEAGGKVHVVLGNHELMILLGDMRYVSGKEKAIAEALETTYTGLFDVQKSILGQWLASKPGLIKINDILFAHGGVSARYMGFSFNTFNDSLYKFMHEPEFPGLLSSETKTVRGDSALYKKRLYFFYGGSSVFWNREYLQAETDSLVDARKKDLKKVLKRYKSKYHIIAHTPVPFIQALYDDKLIAVDLAKAATEMLFLEKKGKKYKRYRYTMKDGRIKF